MNTPIDYPKEYDNSGRVENSKELLDKFISDAAEFRDNPNLDAEFDLSYGPQMRNRMDIFWPNDEKGQAKKSPIVMFIHGGYWQILDRSAFSHLATGLNANGIAVAMPSYTLCPDIKIGGIINEMRRACLVLFQTYRKKITVIGHSAGGHLAACMMATDWTAIHNELPDDLVTSGLGISGIYDLMPITKTPVNDAVRMTEEEATAASPMKWIPEALHRFEAWVGEEESNEYHRQSRELAAYWSMCGTPTNYVPVAKANHFTVVDELVKSDSAMVKQIIELISNPVQGADITKPGDEEIDAFLKAEANSQKPKQKKKESRKKSKKSKPVDEKTAKTEHQKSAAPLKASIGGKAPPKRMPKQSASKPKKPEQNNKGD